MKKTTDDVARAKAAHESACEKTEALELAHIAAMRHGTKLEKIVAHKAALKAQDDRARTGLALYVALEERDLAAGDPDVAACYLPALLQALRAHVDAAAALSLEADRLAQAGDYRGAAECRVQRNEARHAAQLLRSQAAAAHKRLTARYASEHGVRVPAFPQVTLIPGSTTHIVEATIDAIARRVQDGPSVEKNVEKIRGLDREEIETRANLERERRALEEQQKADGEWRDSRHSDYIERNQARAKEIAATQEHNVKVVAEANRERDELARAHSRREKRGAPASSPATAIDPGTPSTVERGGRRVGATSSDVIP